MNLNVRIYPLFVNGSGDVFIVAGCCLETIEGAQTAPNVQENVIDAFRDMDYAMDAKGKRRHRVYTMDSDGKFEPGLLGVGAKLRNEWTESAGIPPLQIMFIEGPIFDRNQDALASLAMRGEAGEKNISQPAAVPSDREVREDGHIVNIPLGRRRVADDDLNDNGAQKLLAAIMGMEMAKEHEREVEEDIFSQGRGGSSGGAGASASWDDTRTSEPLTASVPFLDAPTPVDTGSSSAPDATSHSSSQSCSDRSDSSSPYSSSSGSDTSSSGSSDSGSSSGSCD